MYVLLLILTLALLVLVVPEKSSAVVVKGRVVDVSMQGLGGITVELYTVDGVFKERTLTDRNGYFYFDLKKGVYELVIYGAGYEEKRIKIEVPGKGYVILKTIVLNYALQIQLEAEKIRVKQGDKVELSLVVVNKGHYEEPVNVELSYPPGWEVYLISQSDVRVQGFTLIPGASISLRLIMVIGRSAEGAYTVLLTFKGNVIMEKRIEVYAEPRNWGLIDTQYSRVTGYTGEELVIDLSVKNTIGESADINLNVVGPENWDIKLQASDGHTISSIRLDEEAEAGLQIKVYIPEDTCEGTYKINVTADALGAHSELVILVDVKRGTDKLKIESASPFVEAYAGEIAVIPLKVSNRGSSATPVTFTVIGLPNDFTYSLKEKEGSLVSKIYLSGGETRELLMEIDIPPGTEPQLIEFSLKVEGEKSSDEIKLGLNVLGEYKLKVITENFYVSTMVGERTKFRIDIKNEGNAPLTDVVVEVYDVPRGIEISVEPNIITSLPPNEVKSFTLTIDIDPQVSTGFYHVSLRIVAKGVRVERVLKVDVKPKGENIYIGLFAILLAILAIAYVWRKYGRR